MFLELNVLLDSFQAYYNPLALVIIMSAFLLNPTRTFKHEARFWMLRVLSRIVLAPFFYVGFADFWVADQVIITVFKVPTSVPTSVPISVPAN